jgi:hypothetical protein
MTDLGLTFDSVAANDVQRAPSTRKTKYAPLIDATYNLTPGQAIRIPIPEGADPEKTRTNVSNAVRVKAAAHFSANGLDQKVRVVLATDRSTGERYVGIVCSEMNQD